MNRGEMAVLGKGVTSVSSQVNRPISTAFKVGDPDREC